MTDLDDNRHTIVIMVVVMFRFATRLGIAEGVRDKASPDVSAVVGDSGCSNQQRNRDEGAAARHGGRGGYPSDSESEPQPARQ